MNPALPQTVHEWRALGYRGLRIPRCPNCGHGTERSWDELRATPFEDVVEAARRIRC